MTTGLPGWQTFPSRRPTEIQVTENDVLSGRGVHIAQHKGNERFRALVRSRYDDNYCSLYTTALKRAVAEDIINHISELNPPGRFLKRLGRSNKSNRGLDGPWERLTTDEVMKKTCQALRDCNRQDRAGYAASVKSIPHDVQMSAHMRIQTGMSNKELAETAAAVSMRTTDKPLSKTRKPKRSHIKRPREEFEQPHTLNSGDLAPTLKPAQQESTLNSTQPRQPTPLNSSQLAPTLHSADLEPTSVFPTTSQHSTSDAAVLSEIPPVTPATPVSSGELVALDSTAQIDFFGGASHNAYTAFDDYTAMSLLNPHHLSLPVDGGDADFGDHAYRPFDSKLHAASDSELLVDHLQLAAQAAAAQHPHLSRPLGDDDEFGGPSSSMPTMESLDDSADDARNNSSAHNHVFLT